MISLPGQNMDVEIWILSRHQLARVTREMSERSQHSLQQQFVHVVQPRKLNETEKRQTKREELRLELESFVGERLNSDCSDHM